MVEKNEENKERIQVVGEKKRENKRENKRKMNAKKKKKHFE